MTISPSTNLVALLLPLMVTITVGAPAQTAHRNASVQSTQFKGRAFNKALADSLAAMVQTDQVAANIPMGKYKEYSRKAWEQFKDSVFSTHQVILERVFSQYGYPGYDLVGASGKHDYWLMVQHCDKTPGFQERILTAMKEEVKRNNAHASNYAYLTDRVRINTGRKQLYGTQVMYNWIAVPKGRYTVYLLRKKKPRLMAAGVFLLFNRYVMQTGVQHAWRVPYFSLTACCAFTNSCFSSASLAITTLP